MFVWKLGNAGPGEAGELWEGREAGTGERRKGGEKVLGIFALGRVNVLSFPGEFVSLTRSSQALKKKRKSHETLKLICLLVTSCTHLK